MTLQFEGVGFGTGTGAGGKIGTVALVAMGSEPSTPYTVGSKWFYNGKIYTATSTSAHDSGVTPSYDTAYLYNGTYYYWDGSTLQGADESNLVHITGAETITGNKTFSGTNNLGDTTSATTQPTSDTSDKVATTQFVKDFAQDGEWQKPSDWVDIRSGVLPNSIYFLAAHSKPTESGGVYSIATFPKFSILAAVSTSGHTYDVFVDGKKVATTSTGVATTIDWAELYNNGIIDSGYDVNYPLELTTHIVRVTPSNEEDTLTRIKHSIISGQRYHGTLWMHFELDNEIRVEECCGVEVSSNLELTRIEAITAKNDTLKPLEMSIGESGLYRFVQHCSSLVKIPTIQAKGEYTLRLGSAFYGTKIKKIVIKGNKGDERIDVLNEANRLEELDIENPLILLTAVTSSYTARNAYRLKTFPKIRFSSIATTCVISRLDSIKPTCIDDSGNIARTLFRFFGASGHRTNLVGLVVSSEAPFSYATAPQISITYTNMNRDALVRLFNSMPTVSDNQEIDITGAIGASDLTAEDLAIATGKGWTVTR